MASREARRSRQISLPGDLHVGTWVALGIGVTHLSLWNFVGDSLKPGIGRGIANAMNFRRTGKEGQLKALWVGLPVQTLRRIA